MKYNLPQVKRFAQKIINKLGYDIRRLSKNPLRASMGEAYLQIANLGFLPNTIIDVGVAKGTYELYDAFPSSRFLLIEPVKEFEAYINMIKKQYNAQYIRSAAGSQTGEIMINVHKHHLHGSSILKETMGTEADGEARTVPIIRIDDEIKKLKHQGPFLIKIDVQGAEINVIEGCSGILKETEIIVLEVSMFEFMKEGPQFYDIVVHMKTLGFVAYDIILGWNRPFDNALGQIDIMFVKEKGMFRTSHFYSTIDQLKTDIATQ